MVSIIVTKSCVLEVLRVEVQVSCPLTWVSDAAGVGLSNSWDNMTIVRVLTLAASESGKSSVIVEEGGVSSAVCIKAATVAVVRVVT